MIVAYMINSDQMKHMSQKGVPKQSHQYTMYPSGNNDGVYFLMQTVIKVPNVIL